MIYEDIFDKQAPEVKRYTLSSDTLEVQIINLGATITSIRYTCDNRDVVLGFDTVKEYKEATTFFGATIGRCANRIRKGTFTLHDKEYTLAINDGSNSLHGGPTGFHQRMFHAEIENDILHLHYLSQDQEEGFPGNLSFTVSFQLVQDTLSIHYQAVSDQDTIINFTNHSYFALQGHGEGCVTVQVLKMNADRYMENDEERLVRGTISDVSNTPFDFLEGKTIGQDIHAWEDEQIRFANGYDHYFLFDPKQEHQVSVIDKNSQHQLTITTDLPGFHFYVPSYEEAITGKQGKLYEGHCALCIETSFMPDAIHVQEEPETILKANKVFTSTTTYTFK